MNKDNTIAEERKPDDKFWKGFFLFVLTFWTTVTVLLARYTMVKTSKNPYIKSTVVVFMELIRLVTCMVVLSLQHKGFFKAASNLYSTIKKNPTMSLKLLVPALLYVIQNNMLLFSLSKLTAPMYQVTYQLKILTTAFFSVMMLNKSLRFKQWISLFFLFVGVAIVSLGTMSNDGGDKNSTGDRIASTNDFLLGLGAIIFASTTSGFAGVYFEKMLKNSGFSLWLLNIQLAFYGIISATVTCLSKDMDTIKEKSFLNGYEFCVWALVFMQAYGGLVIALVMKYADNILKGFATSISIVISAFLSKLIFDLPLTSYYCVGATIVIFSVFGYSYY